MQYHSSTSEMIKELKGVKGAFAAVAQTGADKQFNPLVQQQAMLDIAMRLQMSLEVEWVLAQFMEMIHSQLMFDGYSYRLEQPEVVLDSGRQKGHSCSYNLSIEDIAMGQLQLFRGRKFSESELVLLENLLCSLLYPLRNAIQFRKATLSAHCDPLTGVYNRTTFDAALNREMSLAERNGESFSILVIDIDYFKKINDNHGHSAGDEVLKNVADVIQRSIRKTDQLFRFGGEEFVVLLSNSNCEVAGIIAERILSSVRKSSVDYQNQQLSVSVSIGLACLKANDTVMDIFNRADQALYAAKDNGRDQVKVA